MKKIVYLVGPPCCGKTTILHEWAARGGTVVPEFFETVPAYVHDSWLEPVELQIKAQQWALNQHLRKEHYLETIDCEGTILVERSAVDLVVYGKALGREVSLWTETEVKKQRWPDGTLVLLEADIETLKQRWIVGRGISEQQWTQQWGPFSLALLENFNQLKGLQALTISTDTSLQETMRQLDTCLSMDRVDSGHQLLKTYLDLYLDLHLVRK